MRIEEHPGEGQVGPSPNMICTDGSGQLTLVGPAGRLPVPSEDKVTRKLAMLYEGQCAGLGAAGAAARYGYTRQGYYKVLQQYRGQGANAFFNRPGPKTNYRRSDEVVRAVIHHRFQRPGVPAAELVAALRADGLRVSKRSIERIISDFGLQRRDYPKSRAKPRRGTLAPAGPLAQAA